MEKSKLAAAMFIVGSIGLFVHYIPLPPAVIACARAVIGTLFLLLVLRLKKTPLHGQAIRKNALCLLLSGAALGFNWIFLFEAFRHTGIAVATLCYYMAPVFVILLSPLVLGERLTRRKIVCTLLAVLGAVCISGVFTGSRQDPRGIAFGLAAALLGHGLYSHEPAAAINLPSAGILLFVVVTAYRRRRPEAQPVLVSTQEAPLAEIGANLPQ